MSDTDKLGRAVLFAIKDSHRHTLKRWGERAREEGMRESEEWSRMVEAVKYLRSNK